MPVVDGGEVRAREIWDAACRAFDPQTILCEKERRLKELETEAQIRQLLAWAEKELRAGSFDRAQAAVGKVLENNPEHAGARALGTLITTARNEA